MTARRDFAFFGFCFFVSGATALIYEILWVRLLTLTFGNTVYAVGAVLTAFMGGLSLGSYLFGRWADQRDRLLQGYGILEIGIAFFALLSPELLNLVTSGYLALAPADLPGWAGSGLRYFLSFVVLLFPTTLMGGTLPILSRYFIRSEQDLERRLGALYALNTIGGVLGTFLVGFFLIRYFGLSVTLRSTAAVNAAIGVLAYYLGTRRPVAVEAAPAAAVSPPHGASGARFALAAFFLSGFTAMVYEAAWTRLLVEVIGSTTYAFSLILMGFLIGIALGSLVVAVVSGRRTLDLRHFSLAQLGIGISVFFTLAGFHLLPPLMLRGMKWLGPSQHGILILEFLLVLLYLLLPTTLFGATFPIIASVYRGETGRWGSRIGKIYSANTTGCILGSSLAAFVLIPRLGSTLSIRLALAVNILVGLGGLLVLCRRRLAAVCAPLLVLPFLPAAISSHLFDTGVAIYGFAEDYALSSPGQRIVYFKEGPTATISVRAGDGHILLRTNGKTDASTGPDMATQAALGSFPVLLHPAPRSVMVIGLGSGVTVRAVRDFPEIRELECVEIEPAVFEAAEFFTQVNGGVHRDPAVRYYVDDARSHILATRKRFDIIISEPSNPWISGIGSLYSRDFYAAAARRLNEGGLFLQWLHLYALQPEDLRMILATFSAVFPEASLWQPTQGDLLILGGEKPVVSLDWQAIAKRIAPVRRQLKADLGIDDPMDLFSYFITDRAGIRALTQGVPLNTDDQPLLEFKAPLALYSNTTSDNLRMLLNQQRMPPIRGYPQGDPTAEFLYRKSANLARRDMLVDDWWLRRALSIDPLNPDYQVLAAVQSAADPNRRDTAQAAMEGILQVHPGHARAHFELARLLQRDDRVQAGVHFERALALQDGESEFFHEAGAFQLAQGQYGAAARYLRQANALPHPFHLESTLLYLEALSLHKAQDPGSALKVLLQAVAINPYDGNPHRALGDLYLYTGRKDEACREYEIALNLTSDRFVREATKYQIKAACGVLD